MIGGASARLHRQQAEVGGGLAGPDSDASHAAAVDAQPAAETSAAPGALLPAVHAADPVWITYSRHACVSVDLTRDNAGTSSSSSADDPLTAAVRMAAEASATEEEPPVVNGSSSAPPPVALPQDVPQAVEAAQHLWVSVATRAHAAVCEEPTLRRFEYCSQQGWRLASFLASLAAPGGKKCPAAGCGVPPAHHTRTFLHGHGAWSGAEVVLRWWRWC